MEAKIIITSTRHVENTETILIESASYKGSEPFGGMFQVFDADDCIYLNQDGVRMVSVFCSESDGYHEDDMLEFELHDVVTNTITGYVGQIIGSLTLEIAEK